LLRGEKGDLPDLTQINFYSSVAIFSGHIGSHELGRKLGRKGTNRRVSRTSGIWRMRVVASNELLNKVKYRNKDSVRMFVVHFFSPCRAPFSAWAKIV
jgi:hypothetical protein